MARLGDLTNIKTGKLDANASSPDGQYPFFTCSKETLRISSYQYDCECVLVAGNGDLNVKYYNGKFDAYQRTYIIESKDKTVLLVPYLYYFLDEYVEILREQSIGGVIKYIKLRNLTEAKIPLPDLSIQKTAIDRVSRLEQLISFRKQQLSKLDELVKARFVEMFGDLKRNNMNWPSQIFADFAIIDTTMVHDFEKYSDYPHIGIDSIEKETGKLLDFRSVKEDGIISGKYLFTPKHIIYSKIRPNLNKVALPDFTGVCSADAYPILPKEGTCNREFLAYTLRSPVFLDYILAFSNRTNLPKVNKQQVEGFCCPIPDWELQEKFATFYRQVNGRKLTIQQSLDKLEVLRKSLMQEYFG